MIRPVRRTPARLLLAVVAGVVTALSALVGVAPAEASGCTSSHGVTVVVDYASLGGGVVSRCLPDGGGKAAASLFSGAGFALTRVQQFPGAVCRVSGKPAADPCVQMPPATAYWGLFWSSGTSGTWTYATEGVDGLTIPEGGYLGFAWQHGGRTTPGLAPAPHPTPTPSSPPATLPPTTNAPDGPGGDQPTADDPTPTTAPPTSAATTAPTTAPGDPTVAPSKRPHTRPGEAEQTGPGRKHKDKHRTAGERARDAQAASIGEGDEAVVADESGPSDESNRLPGWVPVAVLAGLATVGGVAYVLRGRGMGTG